MAYVAIDILWTIATVVGLLLTWLLTTLVLSHNYRAFCLNPSRPDQFPALNCPILVAKGWTPGNSPRVLYE